MKKRKFVLAQTGEDVKIGDKIAYMSELKHSFGVLKDYTIAGKGFFDFLDYLTAKIMLPFGGLLISLFVGWHLNKKISYEEVTNGGKIGAGFFNLYLFILRYVAPLGILFVFANGLGLI